MKLAVIILNILVINTYSVYKLFSDITYADFRRTLLSEIIDEN
jgi:hypothetical protein